MLKETTKEIDSASALDTRVKPHVRVVNASIDDDGDDVIIQGRVDRDTLRFIKADASYQRDVQNRPELDEAISNGAVVPNLDLAVRALTFESVGADVVITDPVYAIDGWQRCNAVQRVLDRHPNKQIRVNATIHFGTSKKWEAKRFTELNKNVRKVSPNIHLRNIRADNPAVATLYGLCHNEPKFPLFQRVCWSQNMKRGELTTAILIAKAANRLHVPFAGRGATNVDGVVAALNRQAAAVKLDAFRKNVFTFWSTIDACWSLRDITMRNGATQLKATFISELARLFAFHTDFWDRSGRLLFLPTDIRRKLAKFPVDDPHIRQLAGSGGSAGNILQELLLKHMNSGRRTGHLQPREIGIGGTWRNTGGHY